MRERTRINALIDANEVPHARNQSQVVRLGSVTLTDARGNLNPRGQLFETLVNERENLPQHRVQYSTDPFRRGTRTEGRYLVANRLSGQPVRVAQLLHSGNIKVLRTGEAYYRDNRSEYIIHLPVWQNFARRRNPDDVRSRYDSYRNDPLTGQQYSIPINELVMQPRLRNELANQPNLTHVRSRTATVAEQKAFLKEAVVRWLMSHDVTRDEHGRIPLQEYDRSDSYYSFDPADMDAVNFTFDELRTNFHDRTGAPSVETILGRTLHGKVTISDYFWNKAGLCQEALVEQAEGGCVRAQLPTVLLRRHREYESRDAEGVRNKTPLVDCMQPAFTKEEFLARLHEAFTLQWPGRPMGPMREDVAKKFYAEEDRREAKRNAERYGAKYTLSKFVPFFVQYTKKQKTIEEVVQHCSHKTIKGFTPALRQYFKDMSVKERYKSFFKMFPESFIVVDNRVTSRDGQPTSVEEPEAQEEEPEVTIRAPPYQHDDYRYIGDHHNILR